MPNMEAVHKNKILSHAPTSTSTENFKAVHGTFVALKRAHDALKQVRNEVLQTKPYSHTTSRQNNRIDKKIASQNERLDVRAKIVYTGGLLKDGYDHPGSLDIAQDVIHAIKDAKSALDEDEVRQLALSLGVVYNARLEVALESMEEMRDLIPESDKSVLALDDDIYSDSLIRAVIHHDSAGLKSD
ncbi:unnamed protein product [Clonostachys chloroleuca]|uniref:Uncharacterized protein n=1 Tax=Clonostachys chloroleuca TaxID=1926264 RepID=A0AA35LY27_9HYPO|nr:unnamed protein product [Clonostachys chloroleuca]